MSVEQTRRVVTGLVADGGARWLAEAVEVVDMATGDIHRGRAAAAEWLGSTSPPGRFSPRDATIVYADGAVAAAELQAGSGGGLGSLALFCEVRSGEIVTVRVYRSRPPTPDRRAAGKSSGTPGS